MNLLKSILLFLGIISTLNLYSQSKYPLWKDLNSGPYQVGFQTLDYWDKTRSIPGGDDNPYRFFPIQISIWYPTSDTWSDQNALPFNHYFLKTLQKNDFSEPDENQREKALEIFFNYAKYGLSIELTSQELKEIANSSTASLANATKASGKFPVIIAGHDGGVWKMSTLCEYLASHGFIIISTGPLSSTSQMFNQNTQQAINRRIRTLEIVRGMLDQFPQADQSKIGLLGLNLDGISTLLYQMKNREAKAMVSVDGWEGKNNGYEYSKNSIYFDLSAIDIPRLEFHQHENPSNEALYVNTHIFDSLTHIDRLSFILQDFGHAYLTGNTIILPQLSEKVNEQHYFWYESIRDFFNAYLKADEEALKELWNRRSKSGDFFNRDNRIKKINQ